MDVQLMVSQFLGGLGIFLFGIQIMGDGLKKTAGDSLRDLLNRFTSTPLKAVLTGVLVTVLLQSSSGTTVLTVGLVSAGFMKLRQAIGVIMGANIGTTITAFIIGINVGEYALPILGIGAILLFFFKKQLINNTGQIMFGFGALFYGLELMGSGMAPLEDLPAFTNLMVNLSNHPILAAFTGTGMTLIMQSSSATVGILQKLYMQGSVSLDAVLPILFGDNIGTTITAILATIGASTAAKRTAGAHVLFNVIGTVIFLIFLNPFTGLVVWFGQMLNLNPALQIAFAHGLFNIGNVLIQFWFINNIARLMERIIPGKDAIVEYDTTTLDTKFIRISPNLALNQAKLEINQMSKFAIEEFQHSFSYYREQKDNDLSTVVNLEEAVNNIDRRLTEYLMVISAEKLTVAESNELSALIDVMKYLERIGDHSENIANNVKAIIKIEKKKKSKNKEKGRTNGEKPFLYDQDVIDMFEMVESIVKNAILAYEEDDEELANKVISQDPLINKMEIKMRKKYIESVNNGTERSGDGILFIDIVSSLERIGDHSVKIARHVDSKQSFLTISETFDRVGGASRLRPLTPPYVPFGIRRFHFILNMYFIVMLYTRD
ncbi:phosphate:Na+ symporter [Carnobacterium iners]|uniref:Phosphate:Na+ symporter n=1 Tax=Carnobacterium iners TaxID=1073423 RepID=A0A1X7NHJ8_9LACT|nr:Na/Pi cotransporter family protein [Carnobacterium iners]SEK79886.1 phosphate:Na+ symporter [Carnobacterium iners]SMH36834.1 phosphate:Na+ symporter [Carnobacterium iners]